MEKETYTQKINKSAVTGLAVSEEFAREHKAETFTDSVEMPKHRKLRTAAGATQRLKILTAGLLFTSESDFPFKPFAWKREPNEPSFEQITFETIERFAHLDSGTNYYQQSVEEFFTFLDRGEFDSQTREKYLAVRDFITVNLAGATVFRIGRIRVRIFILGIAPDKNIAGIQTLSIET